MKPLLKEDIKSIIINNVLYCNYVIEDEILFMKIRTNFPGANTANSEDVLFLIIQLIENVELKSAAYLSIE